MLLLAKAAAGGPWLCYSQRRELAGKGGEVLAVAVVLERPRLGPRGGSGLSSGCFAERAADLELSAAGEIVGELCSLRIQTSASGGG